MVGPPAWSRGSKKPRWHFNPAASPRAAPPQRRHAGQGITMPCHGYQPIIALLSHQSSVSSFVLRRSYFVLGSALITRYSNTKRPPPGKGTRDARGTTLLRRERKAAASKSPLTGASRLPPTVPGAGGARRFGARLGGHRREGGGRIAATRLSVTPPSGPGRSSSSPVSLGLSAGRGRLVAQSFRTNVTFSVTR
jgi:hypothetical protein